MKFEEVKVMLIQRWLPIATWIQIKDGNEMARILFHRHYSYHPYKDGRNPKLFVGPGEKMVLITPDAKALLVWRRFISRDGQKGVNCAVFRNEGPRLSSELILEAEHLAWQRWPGERLFTYVNPHKIQSQNPGFCFQKAGWRKIGTTKHNRLIILEKIPFSSVDVSKKPALDSRRF